MPVSHIDQLCTAMGSSRINQTCSGELQFISALESHQSLETEKGDTRQRIILDTIAQACDQPSSVYVTWHRTAKVDGLEKLLVICVHLDAALDSQPRSALYRGITRAHMLVNVVNVAVPGGA